MVIDLIVNSQAQTQTQIQNFLFCYNCTSWMPYGLIAKKYQHQKRWRSIKKKLCYKKFQIKNISSLIFMSLIFLALGPQLS